MNRKKNSLFFLKAFGAFWGLWFLICASFSVGFLYLMFRLIMALIHFLEK